MYVFIIHLIIYISNFNLVTNRDKIDHMYETVLNHTYKGYLKKDKGDATVNNPNPNDAVKNPKDYGKWRKAKTTHLVCKIGADDPILISNTYGSAKGNHAEEKMIQELIKKSKVKDSTKSTNSSGPESDIIDKLNKMAIEEPKKESKTEETKSLTITIFINNSPCSQFPHNCTGELIKMLDNNDQVNLILYVANLYNICRESCKVEYHNGFIGQKNHTDNYTGLRNLMLHKRCTIKAFNKDVWKKLFEMMTKLDEPLDDYGNIKEGDERSRKDEDERIQTDLDHIRNNQL